jgi:hypothetical protein
MILATKQSRPTGHSDRTINTISKKYMASNSGVYVDLAVHYQKQYLQCKETGYWGIAYTANSMPSKLEYEQFPDLSYTTNVQHLFNYDLFKRVITLKCRCKIVYICGS